MPIPDRGQVSLRAANKQAEAQHQHGAEADGEGAGQQPGAFATLRDMTIAMLQGGLQLGRGLREVRIPLTDHRGL